MMFAISGTSNVDHLDENAMAAPIEFSDEEFDLPDRAGRAWSAARRNGRP
jgi:aryl-alcohol dehydrogenase-like predicted oxidoreductase